MSAPLPGSSRIDSENAKRHQISDFTGKREKRLNRAGVHQASIIGEARKAMDRLADFDPKIARNMAESYTDLPPKRGT